MRSSDGDRRAASFHEHFMSVREAGCGRPPAAVRVAPLAWRGAEAYRRPVPLYLVPRTRAWQTEEELAAATDCLPAVIDAVCEDVRWIRSYIVQEDDGSFSGYCVYEASSPEVLLRHAEAMRLPTDAIKPVVSTIVAAPDPVRA
jgi:hypothetical protein